jgi:hypothetical protein
MVECVTYMSIRTSVTKIEIKAFNGIVREKYKKMRKKYVSKHSLVKNSCYVL